MTIPTVSVYILTPNWFIRPRNTDWRNQRFSLPRISEFEPSCRMYPSRSLRIAIHANLRYAQGVAANRLHVRFRRARGPILDRKEFFQNGCQVVFCHDDYPLNADAVPVVWRNSVLDPEMQRAAGLTEEQLAAQIAEKEAGFIQARFTQVSSEAERIRLSAWFPRIASRFVVIPYFIPNVRSLGETELEDKLSDNGLLRCLFVGHEARRKGLARVYDAFLALSPAFRRRVHLTVVSSMSDGPVPAPSLPNLTVHGALPFAQAQALIRQSHVFLMPSLSESFGLVYVEAQAQGTIPIVPDWEVQREIVDNGRAGFITNGDRGVLAKIIEQLSEDHELRKTIAWNAWHRFRSHYAPDVVARKYSAVFHRAAVQ